MSTFDISDITAPGAFLNAMKAAQESDRRNAARYVETGDGGSVLKCPLALVRRIVAAVSKTRPSPTTLAPRADNRAAASASWP